MFFFSCWKNFSNKIIPYYEIDVSSLLAKKSFKPVCKHLFVVGIRFSSSYDLTVRYDPTRVIFLLMLWHHSLTPKFFWNNKLCL